MRTEVRLLQHTADMAERGHRATYEPDDGDPVYVIPRSPHLDWRAWFNAIRWAFHSLDADLELGSVADMLDHLADRMESDEAIGALDVNMAISGTDSDSYSARARNLAEKIRVVKDASGVCLDEVDPL